MIMEAITSSDTSVVTTATQRHIPEDGILDTQKELHTAVRLWNLLHQDIAES
jgi:hypothetical protein